MADSNDTSDRFVFDNEHDFLDKLKSLVQSGVSKKDIEILAPHPVHKAEEILSLKSSPVRIFALVGGLIGAATGYLFPTFTVIDWPLISGNRPLVSIPPFTIIAVLFNTHGFTTVPIREYEPPEFRTHVNVVPEKSFCKTVGTGAFVPV